MDVGSLKQSYDSAVVLVVVLVVVVSVVVDKVLVEGTSKHCGSVMPDMSESL
jgi:hypothetical protein